MKAKGSELSECELTTMKCIWDAEKPVTCTEVVKELKDKYGLEYKDTTVYTFINNLKKKGFVDSERKGVTYFWPLRSEEDYRNDVIKKTEKFWFDGSASNFVSALVKTRKLNADEKEKIKRLLDDLD